MDRTTARRPFVVAAEQQLRERARRIEEPTQMELEGFIEQQRRHEDQRKRNRAKQQIGLKVDELAEKQLQKLKSRPAKAALLLRTAAVENGRTEHEISQLRDAADMAAKVAGTKQLEFNLWRAWTMNGTDYLHAVRDKLIRAEKDGYRWNGQTALTSVGRAISTQVLHEMITRLPWQGFEVGATAVQLAAALELSEADVGRALALLEQVGAIQRIKSGRTKRILITPEGAYAGKREAHDSVVRAYAAAITGDAG